MDIKEYISSGVLELYVLGKLDAQESAAVELMAAQHPEVRAELDAIEQALEVYAQMHGQTPPQGTLGEILNRVDQLRPTISGASAGSSPQSPRLFMFLVITAAFVALLHFGHSTGNGETEGQITAVQARLDSIRTSCDLIARENIANRAELAFLKDGATPPHYHAGHTE